jgi:outer membrane receptor protein involved in Fe transport
VEKKLKAITNEASIEKTFGDHSVTAGYYFTHFSSDDFWSLGNAAPLQGVSHGDYVNVSCADLQAAGSGSSCFLFGIRSSGTAESNAGYIADSWQVTQQLRLDAAVRYEDYKLDYSIQTGPGFPDNNPANFSISHLSVQKASFTVGGNYMLNDVMGVFARYSKGTHFPSFDDVRGGDFLNEGVESYEAGYKFHNHAFDAYITGFYDKVKNAFLNDVGGVTQLDDTEAKGVEFDGRWTSDFGFGITGNATIQDTKITKSNIASFEGHKAPRQPKWQLRVSPTYDFDIGAAHATLYGTYFKTDKRYSDSANLQSLPSYDKVDLGLIVEVNRMTFQVVGDNVTNSHGLTEGDPRAVLTANARPILGRSWTFSVGYKF